MLYVCGVALSTPYFFILSFHDGELVAFEFLDLENKLNIPTQELWVKLQSELINLYAIIQQFSIETHDTIAALGVEWYTEPVLTTRQWYHQAVASGTELYAKVTGEILPQAEAKVDELVVAANEFGTKTVDSMMFVIDHPEQVTAESIEFLTESLAGAKDISTELALEIQEKGSEIIALLLEQPLQTLESAYMELLTTLLNSYFELVSNILATL